MTTVNGSTLKPCDPDVFSKGKTVFATHTIPAREIEGWVRKVAEASGQPVDWHYFAGRAVVKTTGDIDAVLAAIETLKPEHDRLYKAANE